MKRSIHKYLFSNPRERDHYYRSLIVKDSLTATVELLSKKDEGTTKTFNDIIFNEISWGSSERVLIRKLGMPRIRFQNINDLEHHTILFFKLEIGGKIAVVQCHLLENELYFLHLNFVMSPFNEVKVIEEMIREKYSVGITSPNSVVSCTDYFQNKLIIQHNVCLNISYISGKHSILHKLEKQMLNNYHSIQLKSKEKQYKLYKLF
jgi:hypothetical protein